MAMGQGQPEGRRLRVVSVQFCHPRSFPPAELDVVSSWRPAPGEKSFEIIWWPGVLVKRGQHVVPWPNVAGIYEAAE